MYIAPQNAHRLPDLVGTRIQEDDPMFNPRPSRQRTTMDSKWPKGRHQWELRFYIPGSAKTVTYVRIGQIKGEMGEVGARPTSCISS